MVIIAGHFLVAEDERDRCVEAHRDLIERARAFYGCLDLSICADPVDPARINNTEVWASAERLDAWRAQADPPDRRRAGRWLDAPRRDRRWTAVLKGSVGLGVDRRVLRGPVLRAGARIEDLLLGTITGYQ